MSEYEELIIPGKQAFISAEYLKEYSFYSNKEREFRYFCWPKSENRRKWSSYISPVGTKAAGF